jgi:uncharacterized DUF497 family protein
VAITFDPVKPAITLRERFLDFADAKCVFASAATATTEDARIDYGERRYRTAGFLRGRLVVIVWTPRGVDRHISFQ